VGDAGSALLGFGLIVGLFVAYAIQRRGSAKGAEPAQAAPVPTEPAAPVEAAAPAEERRGSSPNWGAPIIFVLLLFGAATQRGNGWGYLWQILFGLVVAVGAHTAFSPKEFAAELKRDPQATRATHALTFGIPYVLIPVVAWVVTIPLGRNWGSLIPAAPWALLAVFGIGLVAREALRKPR
jgi:hypothetical protein